MTTAAPAVQTGAPLPSYAEVVIVGTGFSGLGMAVALRRAGREDFVVLERADDVGGTWRENTYPGCACDVPSHVYSFSFAPNPTWSRTFSPQPEIQAYLQRVAREHGVLPHVRFGTELVDARWDDEAQQWEVETSRGTVRARFLVLGAGPLSTPAYPDLPGLDTFAGKAFHSARWDHDHDLTGEKVAVIGTGASAIQFVPHVQRAAAQLNLFQRTPAWVLPRFDRAIRPWETRLFHALPLAQKLNRASIYAYRESTLLGFTSVRPIMKIGERLAKRHLAQQVADPVKRARLTPDYTLGCKRVLLSNDYFRALDEPNAEVVTDRIVEVLPHAVVTASADGRRTEHDTDTIIFGTGFRASDPPAAELVVGRGGVRLAEHWRQTGMAAHRGVTVAGFPNLLFLVGPNTALGHNSIVLMIEAQTRYVVDLLDQLDARGGVVVEPRADVQEAYNAALQRELGGTVWSDGSCASYYLDARGRNTTLWPSFTFSYMRRMSRCDLSEYDVTARRTASETVSA